MTPKAVVTILVVEDEQNISTPVRRLLERESYEVIVEETLGAAKKQVSKHNIALIILDLMLPDGDGLDFCRELRAQGNITPILMITARTHPDEKFEGLNTGADDYLCKPFDLNELSIRVKTLLRRRRWDHEDLHNPGYLNRFAWDENEIIFDKRMACIKGKSISLGKKETLILNCLISHNGSVVSRDELLDVAWGNEATPTPRTVDNFIVKLRKIFDPPDGLGTYFKSHWGEGYSFESKIEPKKK